MKAKFFFILIFGVMSNTIFSQTIDLTIKNVRTKKGILKIGIFKDQKDFSVEKTVYDFNFDKTNLKEGILKVELPIKYGKYALSVLDDANKDGKMNYQFLGIPKEGFGFSNFTLKKPVKPKFSDFSFDVNNNKTVSVEVVMKYL